MIQVYERQSNRVPGITSLYLSFDFNQSIIDTIKNNCEAYDLNNQEKEIRRGEIELVKNTDGDWIVNDDSELQYLIIGGNLEK